jgi:hypothetical protein
LGHLVDVLVSAGLQRLPYGRIQYFSRRRCDEASREPCGEKRERQDLATEGLGTCGIEASHSQRQGTVDNDRMDVHMPLILN